MSLQNEAMDVLKETSRTFYIPISRLPPVLIDAVASAYLCMRAIDEIEDHPTLANKTKAELLRETSLKMQSVTADGVPGQFYDNLNGNQGVLPDVTRRIADWVSLAPQSIAPRIVDAIAAMSDRMAHWAACNWYIRTEADLDRYTFSVAGAVGLLLSDLWNWYDGTQTNRSYAIGFGRGLQAVNILRNHPEDLQRGVDFFPDGWNAQQLDSYARRNLALADKYTGELPAGPALDFCSIPLGLAYATLDVMARGERKLSRTKVLEVVGMAGPQA